MLWFWLAFWLHNQALFLAWTPRTPGLGAAAGAARLRLPAGCGCLNGCAAGLIHLLLALAGGFLGRCFGAFAVLAGEKLAARFDDVVVVRAGARGRLLDLCQQFVMQGLDV